MEAASVFLLLNFPGKLTGTERERGSELPNGERNFRFFSFFIVLLNIILCSSHVRTWS